ncbi:MAG: bifunctional 3-deoxy-7-phosphoheptulonate synthase/chorismate mutase type II [Flavobacteriales bacterium]|jgi:chorismate mutase|nr:bifunctional 3-deoxy-7-phosphoheptulonate synthase/chorismate mutase type II [Flavobacteriales bacterium]
MQSNSIFRRDNNKHQPFLISGPCSAETPEQLLTTAQQLKDKVNLSVLRAGIWKPRTRPNSFEGIGEEALKWLLEVKKELNLSATVEVANAKHVELALKHDVDILWIGARTSVNPFSVQEIADVLKGIDIPVMVKNPINPDLQLWIGAIERIQNVGIHEIAAIHRGFSAYGISTYRNKPMWEIPIELKRLYPDLPIICDPSHIGGKRDMIASISQKAMDLTFDGLMIESHYLPEEAWSDAQQQVTPGALKQIMDQLIIRDAAFSTDTLLELNSLRAKIDSLDEVILDTIAKRMDLIELIGVLKKEQNIPILQVERWNAIIKTFSELAHDLELSEKFIAEFLNAIHTESIRKQTVIMNK